MTTTSLLTTKLQVPHVHSDLVWRPHLLERLSQNLTRQVTLISAPAGFGKTTLLAQWIERAECRVAWISLDESDDDPVRFWLYVITSLQMVDPKLGADALVVLQAGLAGYVPLQSILTSLINDLHALAVDDKIVLVLDDFHLIKTQATQDTLAFFINRQPQQLHVIISSRSDPVLPLARLRARRQLAELRAAELRFSSDEMVEFFNDLMGLRLSEEQITMLEGSSEGWIAGLQLAALSMRGRGDISTFISSFTGNNRYIIDYLVEEVLRQQPEATQSFLLQTSILERLTAPLCDALTQRSDGQTMLESLEKANLFITALDDERRWYRYHHLFAEFLRHSLQRFQMESTPVLHRRASEWHERNGLIAEAVDYALAAGDFRRAAGLIGPVAKTMLLVGDVNRLMGWLDRLPDDLIRSRTDLGLAFAWGLALQGEMQRLEELLSDLESNVAGDDARYVLGSIAALRADEACIRRDALLTLELSNQALELLPADSLVERGIVLLAVGNAHAMEGNLHEANRTLSEGIAVTEATGNKIAGIAGMAALLGVQIVQGRLRQATETYYRALRTAEAANKSSLSHVSFLGMAAVCYEWDDLEAAERHAREGFEFGLRWGRPSHAALGRMHLARVAMANGDWDRADMQLREAEQLLAEHGLSEGASLLAACRLRLWTNQGRVETACKWIQEHGIRPGDIPDQLHEAEYVAMAWLSILMAVRRHDPTPLYGVLSPLERMCQRAETSGRMGNVVEMLAVRSLAYCAMGDMTRAAMHLEHALALAEPEGYVRTFVDFGPMMASLLGQAASRGVTKDYVGTLLEAFERDASRWSADVVATTGSYSGPVFAVSLPEALSERELEVLRLVAEGLSNQEIAQRLVLAVGTVKRHVNNIFGKLGASSRLRAVSRARELGLL